MASTKVLAEHRGDEMLRKEFKGVAVFLFWISGIINVLALTGSFYMLQIYDRALTSGSIPTLLALSVLVIGLYLFQGVFDIVRSQLLVRIGATHTSILAYFLPIIGIVSGALMFQEHIDPIVLAGTALVLAGIALVNGRFFKRQLYGRRAPEPGTST